MDSVPLAVFQRSLKAKVCVEAAVWENSSRNIRPVAITLASDAMRSPSLMASSMTWDSKVQIAASYALGKLVDSALVRWQDYKLTWNQYCSLSGSCFGLRSRKHFGILFITLISQTITNGLSFIGHVRIRRCFSPQCVLEMSKRYISTYLPGDVALMHDGSIGLIVKVHVVTTSGHLSWNYLYDSDSSSVGRVLEESYAVDVIPGYPCSKCAWWKLEDFKQVLCGPLHQVLNREQVFQLEELPALPDASGKAPLTTVDGPSASDERSAASTQRVPLFSSIAPIGRGHCSARRIR